MSQPPAGCSVPRYSAPVILLSGALDWDMRAVNGTARALATKHNLSIRGKRPVLGSQGIIPMSHRPSSLLMREHQMKKPAFTLMLAALCCLSVSASAGTSHNYNINVRNNMLAFATAQDYYTVIGVLSPDEKEAFRNDVSANYRFNSLAKNNTSPLFTKIDDEFFSSIINHQGYVQIGNNIYKVDPMAGVVRVIPASNPELINEMESGNYTNALIKTYLDDDEVVGMVEAGVSPAYSRLFCGETGAAAEEASGFMNVNHPATNQPCNWIDCWVSYKKFGIYFSLKAKAINTSPCRTVYWHKTPAAYKVKCGYTYGPVYQWDIPTGSVGSPGWVWNQYFYQNVQPLHAYWLRVVFMAKDPNWIGNPNNPSVDIEIKKNM
jgi:hypothetical protein